MRHGNILRTPTITRLARWNRLLRASRVCTRERGANIFSTSQSRVFGAVLPSSRCSVRCTSEAPNRKLIDPTRSWIAQDAL